MQIVNQIAEVVANFNCSAAVDSARNYGSGHINDTFFLKNATSSGPDYLLQRINHHIFTNVEKLTDNMRKVTEHLKCKLAQNGSGDPLKEVMTLIPATDGRFYYQDSVGDYWRMFYFLSDTKSYDVVSTPTQAYEGGKAFGKFQYMLSDIAPGEMFEVIPNFHNIQYRLQQLSEAIANNAAGRVSSVAAELDIVTKYAESMQYFQQPGQVAALPKRVIHNDTKFNNVLLDSNDKAQCVIDLETVMDGYVAYDFGDAIRTIINTSTEDEADLDKIQLNMPLFEAYVKGYLKEAAKFLEATEVDSLMKGALLLPFMQAVRFLTDHINGDVYFKTKFPGHNLQRARAQFRLFLMLNDKASEMQDMILTEMESLSPATN
ncbi:phosphotransferase enzyme family protein [Mucilaginibacter psychrotolerans]|uniref:Aminoglycoside phosphotransferase family protein n=1 Tax=Mucilaginibacter psychrotolerans TaxID=1524096 RepID=A0A4Y8S786_9SPHI|nr:aminoglycoside phosphotransferase family protein [Mucilaginibacter psychrotolerans]TFF34481.1 aminoglycoside phosphotransferase family protein [Mucilaginibacter psychrotolerans]